MANKNKEKGAKLERYTAQELTKYTGKVWRRTIGSGAAMGGKNASKGGNFLVLGGDLAPPEEYKDWVIECKNSKSITYDKMITIGKGIEGIDKYLRQLRADMKTAKSHNGALVMKNNKSKEPIVLIFVPEASNTQLTYTSEAGNTYIILRMQEFAEYIIEDYENKTF